MFKTPLLSQDDNLVFSSVSTIHLFTHTEKGYLTINVLIRHLVQSEHPVSKRPETIFTKFQPRTHPWGPLSSPIKDTLR